jgi:hypothetical protein
MAMKNSISPAPTPPSTRQAPFHRKYPTKSAGVTLQATASASSTRRPVDENLQIIAESEKDGWKGLSGRDAIKMFNEFYTTYARDDKLIDMLMLGKFFRKYCKEDRDILPVGFLDSLQRMYNYTVLQEVKESLYYYNEEQISRDIQNYMFAVNFETGRVETCQFTREKIEISGRKSEMPWGRLLACRKCKSKRDSSTICFSTGRLEAYPTCACESGVGF